MTFMLKEQKRKPEEKSAECGDQDTNLYLALLHIGYALTRGRVSNTVRESS